MAKLTKKQANAVEMIAIYYSMAITELETNGVTDKYDEHMWAYAHYRAQLGLDVSRLQRLAADRFWEKKQAAA